MNRPVSISLDPVHWAFLWTVLYDAGRDNRHPSQYPVIAEIQNAIRAATGLNLTRETLDKAVAGVLSEKN
jgi:hypothetical protein